VKFVVNYTTFHFKLVASRIKERPLNLVLKLIFLHRLSLNRVECTLPVLRQPLDPYPFLNVLVAPMLGIRGFHVHICSVIRVY